MERKQYQEPVLETVLMEQVDIICTSEPTVSLEAPVLDDDVFAQ